MQSPARRSSRRPRTQLTVRGDRGQATVEFVLVLPMLMAIMLVGVQVYLVMRAQIAVTHAAREGARAAAVSAVPATAALRAARASIALDNLEVITAPAGGRVRVTVRSVVHTDVPLVGLAIGDVTVTAEATMAVEA